MSLSACPDCGGELGRGAMKCRCGWTAPGAAKAGERPSVPCAADSMCRLAGRLWTRNHLPNERICVDHYYVEVNRDGSLAGEPVIPPKMGGVQAKPVAGG